jgi:ribonuclease BN (tRNA processing enzyme)
MQALVLGCGEAFDERLPNTSLLLRTGQMTALLDCGYSVPPRVFTHVGADEVDLIYVSHAHADHYFGLPAVLGRWWEDGRTKPLTIVSQQPVIDQIKDILEYGYRTLPARFKFPIEYRAADTGQSIEVFGATCDFAPTKHAVTNYAIRVRADERTFCYSGDGMFTDESANLCTGADLVVHEAFWFEPSPVHADIPSLLEMAKQRDVKRLALVHVQRGVRRNPERVRDAMRDSGIDVVMPEPEDRFDLTEIP